MMPVCGTTSRGRGEARGGEGENEDLPRTLALASSRLPDSVELLGASCTQVSPGPRALPTTSSWSFNRVGPGASGHVPAVTQSMEARVCRHVRTRVPV